jgi:hypothetical protein
MVARSSRPASPARPTDRAFIAGNADDPEAQACARTFRQGLEALGWVDGKNVSVDDRWTGGDADDLRPDTTNLVSLAPEVILSGGTPATTDLKGDPDHTHRFRAR